MPPLGMAVYRMIGLLAGSICQSVNKGRAGQMAGKHDREGGEAADVQDEILAAACNALDKAHDLLSFLIRYDGKVTPAYMERVKDWVDGEFDPGARKPKRCRHNWSKCALTPNMYCTRCGVPRAVGCQ